MSGWTDLTSPRRFLTALTVICLVLGGCGQPESSTGRESGVAIAGQLVFIGGLKGSPSVGLRGEVVFRDGNEMYSFITDRSGNFEGEVPAGDYDVVGRSPDFQEGASGCSIDGGLEIDSAPRRDLQVICTG